MRVWHALEWIRDTWLPLRPYLPALQTGLCVAAFLLLGFGIVRELRSPWRQASVRSSRGMLMGMGLLAVFVRLGLVPALTRHTYDGHEADYFDAWRGVGHSLGVGYRASDWMGWLYSSVGGLFGGSGLALMLLTLASSLLAIPCVYYVARRLGASPTGSAVACLLLAIDPVHAFWASSAYNIELPFVLLMAAWASLELGNKTGQLAPLLASGFFLSTAVAARAESVLLAPVLLVRLLTAGPRQRRPLPLMVWLGSMTPMLIHLALEAQALAGQAPGEYAAELAQQQWSLWIYLSPWSQAGIRELWLCVWVLTLARSPWTRAPLVLCLLLVLGQHAATIRFDDYDFRHTLLSRAALALGMGICWSALCEGGRLARFRLPAMGVVGALCLLLIWTTYGLGKRYYADWELFLHDVPEFASAPHLNLEQYKTCVFVAEDAYYARFMRASHFELYTQRDRERLSQRGQGCILFVLDLENYQASSRAIDGRAAKIAHFYSLTLLGKVVDREAEHASLVYQVGPKRGLF